MFHSAETESIRWTSDTIYCQIMVCIQMMGDVQDGIDFCSTSVCNCIWCIGYFLPQTSHKIMWRVDICERLFKVTSILVISTHANFYILPLSQQAVMRTQGIQVMKNSLKQFHFCQETKTKKMVCSNTFHQKCYVYVILIAIIFQILSPFLILLQKQCPPQSL